MDFKKMKEDLRKSKESLDILDKNLNLLKLEKQYQHFINSLGLSTAYLEGCSFYLGPSLIKYLEDKKKTVVF